MKLKENKKADKKETSLSEKTWNMVKDVATNEKKVNGQMLFICKNTFDIFKNGNMDLAPYFGEKINNVLSIFGFGEKLFGLMSKIFLIFNFQLAKIVNRL